jgi:large subunit ribosomal protein L22
MEARATARYVRVSTRKTNQVLDLVRGQDVESAIQLLTFTPKAVARTVLKVLKSAVANAVVKEARLNPEDLVVKECLVGPAPIMKRFLPRAQGRATPILKRSCHITIVVGAREDVLEHLESTPVGRSRSSEAAAPAAGEATPRKPAARPAAAGKKPAGKKTAAGRQKPAGKAKKKTKQTAAAAGKPAGKGSAVKKPKEKAKSPLRESKRG